MYIFTAVINAFYQLKAAVPSRPHPAMHSSCSACPQKHNTVTEQARGWSWGTAALCRGSGGKEIKVPRGAGWAAFLKRAEDTLKCALVCLCERVLVLGLRGRSYKSISRVYGVFSTDTSCLSSLKDKSSTELFPVVHHTFPSLSLHEVAAPVYSPVYFIFLLR